MSSNTATHPDIPSRSAVLSRRTTRRGLVGAWALCCLGFLALAVFEVKGAVWFILFALAFASDILLYLSTHRVTDRPTSALDEREQTVRNRAYRSAYLLLFYAIILAVGGAMLLLYTGNLLLPQWLSHPAAHPVLLTGFGVATLQLVSLLPTALVAWTERDEPVEFD
jgi:hypothetical protein